MSKFRRVTPHKVYRYVPVPLDRFDARTDLSYGDIVKVINRPGAPPANTAGHCYVEKDGKVAGLVVTNSLITEDEFTILEAQREMLRR